MPFVRAHHRRIARVLASLDASQLRDRQCLFAGGTAITLRYGEYRESVEIDFLVSDAGRYRELRTLLTGAGGLAPIVRAGATPLIVEAGLKADQYGIRTRVLVDDQPIKLEIVREARIELEIPSADDEICGIATLTPLDMATSKLLANSDRWADDGVFSRDLIDLAMMRPRRPLLRRAVEKAERAYGDAVLRDLARAIQRIADRSGRLERCLGALAMRDPPALVWQRIRALKSVLPES